MDGPETLTGRRKSAAPRLVDLALPREAEEIWRYSGIDRFDLGRFAPVPIEPPAAGGQAIALDRARELADPLGPRSALVVAVHGQVLCADTEPGSPSALLGVARDDLEEEADQATEQDAFSVLHDAFVPDVVAISVPDGVVLRAPVVVVHLVDPSAEPSPEQAPACFPETVVRIGRDAEGGVVELLATIGDSDRPALVVPLTDLEVGEGGRLSYANLQVLGEGATHIGTQRSRVGRDGSLRSFAVGLGGAYARVRTDSDLIGQGASSALLAAYLGTGDQVHDFRTLQDHHGLRTDSELLFTGAVADRARSVYSGLIRIRHGARKADARQTNHNLVLSEGAHADSVPNLDIDENDVKCSHASTVGPIDQEQRYYLESRGIEPAVAERLIVLGFFSDIAARSPFPEVGRWVSRSVARRLAGRLPAEQQPASVGAGPGGGTSG